MHTRISITHNPKLRDNLIATLEELGFDADLLEEYSTITMLRYVNQVLPGSHINYSREE